MRSRRIPGKRFTKIFDNPTVALVFDVFQQTYFTLVAVTTHDNEIEDFVPVSIGGLSIFNGNHYHLWKM